MKKQAIIPETKSFVVIEKYGLCQQPSNWDISGNEHGSDTGGGNTGTGEGGDDVGARGGSMWSGGDWDEEF